MYKWLLLLSLLSPTAQAATFPTAPDLSDAQRSQLKQGKTLLREIPETRKGQTFEAITIIPRPPQAVITLLQDYERHPSFMPNLEHIEVLEKGQDHAVINQTLKLPLGKIKRYRLENQIIHSAQAIALRWRMLQWPEVPKDERIGDTQGYWLLLPYDEHQTMAVYHVYTDPGHVPFGLGWIVDILSGKSIPDVINNTREYAQRQ